MKGREKEGKRRHIIIYTRAYGCARERKRRRIKRKEEEGDTKDETGEILTKQGGRGRERERGCKILETSGERLVEKQGDHRRETGRFS